MTLARYYAGVVVIYFSAFLALAIVWGELGFHIESLRIWSLPFVGAALGAFFTWITMSRFGNAAGSVYFLPTVGHVTFLLVLAFVVTRSVLV